jgi:hypothetical protein
MEPRREELSREPKVTTPASEKKLQRFRIVKLEERIAPSRGGEGTQHCPRPTPDTSGHNSIE